MVLVVIGIPIALQVDNWNEDRNEKVREAKLLKELVKNNEYNNENIGRYIKGKDRYNNYSD